MSNTEANTHSSSDGTGVDRSDRGDTAGSGGGTAWSVAISAETEMIMGSVISKNSAKTYLNKNVQFLTWIYDNADTQELLLTEWCIQKLKAAADTDTAQSTAKKRAARKYFCNELSKIICSIDRNNAATHPIFDSKISFEIFYSIHEHKEEKNNSTTGCKRR